jgi:hypothetical protein
VNGAYGQGDRVGGDASVTLDVTRPSTPKSTPIGRLSQACAILAPVSKALKIFNDQGVTGGALAVISQPRSWRFCHPSRTHARGRAPFPESHRPQLSSPPCDGVSASAETDLAKPVFAGPGWDVPERLLDVVRMQYRPVIERMSELIGRNCLSLVRTGWSAIDSRAEWAGGGYLGELAWDLSVIGRPQLTTARPPPPRRQLPRSPPKARKTAAAPKLPLPRDRAGRRPCIPIGRMVSVRPARSRDRRSKRART